jgi:Flp pilus assembly protein TadG
MNVQRHTRERGANLIEAALVDPLLLMLLATVIDLGRAYFSYITIINAAREGARYGVAHPTDTSAICAKVLAEARDQSPPVNLTCPGSVTIASGGASGSPIRVTVNYNFPVIMGGILGRATVPIYYSVAFRIR